MHRGLLSCTCTVCGVVWAGVIVFKLMRAVVSNRAAGTLDWVFW